MKNRFIKFSGVVFIGAVLFFVMSCQKDELSITPSVSDVVFTANGDNATADGSPFNPVTFTVQTNQSSWDVVSNRSWVTIDRSGSGDTFTLNAQPVSVVNAPWPAEITVTAGTKSIKIKISQLDGTPSLTVTPAYRTVVFSDDGGTATSDDGVFEPTFTVKENVGSWKAVSDKPWLEVIEKENTFTLSAKPFSGLVSPEEAKVTVSAGKADQVVITVMQDAYIPNEETDLYGFITDTDKNPVAGVVVSDGYQCVVTEENGAYHMKRNANAKFVFYSTPAEYEVNPLSSTNNAALFYTALTGNNNRYNFTLKKLPTVETEFNLLAIGDPQVASTPNLTRYTNEAHADMVQLINASSKPTYGIVLGDLTGDQPGFNTPVRDVIGSANMKFFATIGNHDKTGGNATTPRNAVVFCSVYGPLNYSFNRGDVHFVCLDNNVYTDNANYSGGFEEYQIEWLKQDLSHVPKDKLIIVYYHIPIRNTAGIKNRTGFLNALRDFNKIHLMCGHTHYHENFTVTTAHTPIYEHIHAATCGVWWHSNLNADGTPNGYGVYEIKGTELTNWYYKSTRYDKSFQIRLHWGDTQFGGQYGYYSYNQGRRIVANVWNYDSNWTLEAYEDGVFAGNLTQIAASMIDAFAAGYNCGVVGRNPANYGATGTGTNKHAFGHTLKNPNAQVIEIHATDKFGNVYIQSEIISSLTTAGTYP